MGLDRWEATK